MIVCVEYDAHKEKRPSKRDAIKENKKYPYRHGGRKFKRLKS